MKGTTMQAAAKMREHMTIGLVVPFATDKVPVEGPMMYPGVKFIPRGVGVRSLTPAGYDAAWNGILPAAMHLAKQGVDAIMVIGTSLTFYRGYEAHKELLAQLRAETGLPVSTMSEAVVDGLRSVGAKRIAVATAYADEVNNRLADFLRKAGFEVLAMEGFGLFGFGEPGSKSESDIIALKHAGCVSVQFGLESGSEEVRLKIYRKGYTDEIVYGIPKLLRKHKITYRTNNIMGSPAETLEDMFETARVNKRIKPNGCTVLIYRPFKIRLVESV